MTNVGIPDALTTSTLRQYPGLREYLNNVRDWHGFVRFLGLSDRRDNPDVLIDRLFVEPQLVQRYISPDAPRLRRNARPETIFETLSLGKPIVILGDPGSGKSTLINYIVWLLARPGNNIWSKKMGEWLLPAPMVLRELSLDGVLSFDELLRAFLNHSMCHPLQNGRYFEKCLQKERVIFCLDGIDEVGDLASRQRLRKAIFDGIARYPNCKWLLSSRIVGYDEVPFHVLGDRERARLGKKYAGPTFQPDFQRVDDNAPFGVDQKDKVVRDGTDDYFVIKRYMSPFDDKRIEAFARNWYSRREAAVSRARESAKHLVNAIHADDAILRLARIPNLLTMMALIHRVEATLPDGRALLYERIAEAYLELIDKSKGVLSGAFNLSQKRDWLARIAFEMQRARSAGRSKERGSDEIGLLVDTEDVVGWVEEEIQKGIEDPGGMRATDFLDLIGRRSGLFLPRGEGKYAFVHLSFQEYFSAVALEQEVTSLNWAKGRPTQLGVQKSTIRRYAGESLWFETFSFLFELLAQRREWHHNLVEIVFGKSFIYTFKETSKRKREIRLNLALLLTRLINNPLAGLPGESKETAIKAVVRATVEPGKYDQEDSSVVLRELLGEDEAFNTLVMEAIAAQVQELDIEYLDLSLTKISDIFPLQNTACLVELNLHGTRISNIEALKGLSKLKTLDLSNTSVVDISPLKHLSRLETLSLWNTAVEDIVALTKLKSLSKLDLDNTNIANIEPLSGLTRLESLELVGTSVSDLSPLVRNRSLERLKLEDTKVTDLEPLRRLKKIKYLDLDGTRIVNLEALQDLKQLEALYLKGTGVSSLTPLSRLTSLETLRLWDTKVSDLEPVRHLVSLTFLDLDGTDVFDLEPLIHLRGLRHLDLRNLEIAESMGDKISAALPKCEIFL